MINIETDTFCGAPWFQCRNTNQGQYRACCVIDHNLSEFSGQKFYKFPDTSVNDWMNSDYMQYLRKNLSNGVKLKECTGCWAREENNILSERQVINSRIFDLNGMSPAIIKSYFKNKNNNIFDLLLVADIKLSNSCNFSCLMCNPEDSSQLYTLWLKNHDKWFVQKELQKNPRYFEVIKEAFVNKDNRNLLVSILDMKPRIIKLLGGEPLMDEQLIQILSELSLKQQSQTALQIITNGSYDLVSVKKRLINFKNLTYTISLEGVEQVQDFVRKGSVWHKIEQNIDKYIKIYGTSDLSIHTTIQALTLFHFNKLLSWAKNKNIRLDFLLLKTPEYLSLEALPPELINNSIQNLKPFQDSQIINLISNLKKKK